MSGLSDIFNAVMPDPATIHAAISWTESFYESLPSEFKACLWIALVIVGLLILAGGIAAIYFLIRRLNKVLVSPYEQYAGIKPINALYVIWAGAALWAVCLAFILKYETPQTDEVLTARDFLLPVAVLASVCFIIRVVCVFRPRRACGVVLVNFGFGIIAVPALIHLGIIIATIAVALFVLYAWLCRESRTVYVRPY